MTVSFKQKKDKMVLLLSSQHNIPGVGDKRTAQVSPYHHKTEGGADVLDNMYTTPQRLYTPQVLWKR